MFFLKYRYIYLLFILLILIIVFIILLEFKESLAGKSKVSSAKIGITVFDFLQQFGQLCFFKSQSSIHFFPNKCPQPKTLILCCPVNKASS